MISIPHGTIKTNGATQLAETWYISIPHGTIKTLDDGHFLPRIGIFQFHMVRLRPVCSISLLSILPFQFHMVRLRQS